MTERSLWKIILFWIVILGEDGNEIVFHFFFCAPSSRLLMFKERRRLRPKYWSKRRTKNDKHLIKHTAIHTHSRFLKRAPLESLKCFLAGPELNEEQEPHFFLARSPCNNRLMCLYFHLSSAIMVLDASLWLYP